MVSPNRRNFRDVYIVTDFMETDLQHIISSPQTLTDSHIKYFTYQILRGLKYVHTANISCCCHQSSTPLVVVSLLAVALSRTRLLSLALVCVCVPLP